MLSMDVIGTRYHKKCYAILAFYLDGNLCQPGGQAA